MIAQMVRAVLFAIATVATLVGFRASRSARRDLKPELEQFAVDPWRAPKQIFDADPPDQRAQLRVDLRPPSQWERLPTPVAA
jgi:hypothetical protein